MKWFFVRALAGVALLALCWLVLAASGYIEIVLLMLLAAFLGGVVVRPARERRFRPDTWRRERTVTIPRGD